MELYEVVLSALGILASVGILGYFGKIVIRAERVVSKFESFEKEIQYVGVKVDAICEANEVHYGNGWSKTYNRVKSEGLEKLNYMKDKK